jgi:hypothetical protein
VTDWTDVGSYAYNKLQRENESLRAELERVAPGYATLHKQAEIRQQLTDLERQSLEDLQRLVETQRYDLDAMSAIKEERDECYVLLRQALEALELLTADKRVANLGAASAARAAIAALRERLKP